MGASIPERYFRASLLTMKSLKHKYALEVVVGFLMISALLGCGSSDAEKSAAAAPQMPATPVTMVTAQPASVNDTSEYVATLKSRGSSVINPQVEGQITNIYVKSGARVNAGTPLM